MVTWGLDPLHCTLSIPTQLLDVSKIYIPPHWLGYIGGKLMSLKDIRYKVMLFTHNIRGKDAKSTYVIKQRLINQLKSHFDIEVEKVTNDVYLLYKTYNNKKIGLKVYTIKKIKRFLADKYPEAELYITRKVTDKLESQVLKTIQEAETEEKGDTFTGRIFIRSKEVGIAFYYSDRKRFEELYRDKAGKQVIVKIVHVFE